MRVGLCFDGFYSIKEMVELAKFADDLGMDSLWMSDHLCFRDCLTSSMAFLATTSRITIVPAPLSPYSRHPIISAMAIATMEELTPGRIAVTAGTGNAAALNEVGLVVTRPLKMMQEYMQVLRSFLSGKTVNFQGEMLQIHGAKMGFKPSSPIPIYMTAVKNGMLRLSGEIGDGSLLSAGCAPKYISRCINEVKRGAENVGKTLKDREIAGFITTSVSEDTSEAMDASKTFLAYIFRNKHHAENIRMGGGKIDQESLADAVRKRDWNGAKKLISDEVVFAHSISGTFSHCRDRLQDFLDSGLTLPILLPMGTQEARKKVIELSRDL